MNEQTLPLTSTIPSEVRLFLAVVRRELGDLGPDEVAEMTDGLEADLTDLVGERGVDALGDPKAYAAELRAAAGVGTAGKAPRSRRPVRESLTACLDACHGWYDQQVDRLPGDPEPLVGWLRPAWWILRAWVAVNLVGLYFGMGSTGVVLGPSFGGLGWLVLGVSIFLSVMIGRGRVWPGGDRGLFARLALLGLNSFAVVMTPLVVSTAGSSDYDYRDWDAAYQQGIADGRSTAPDTGLVLDGKHVSNVYPFDAAGRPIAGVQLFDQDGHPLAVSAESTCPKGTERENQSSETDLSEEIVACHDGSTMTNVPGTVFYPWTNGQAQLKNVFPLASRQQEELDPSATAFQEDDAPTLGDWPFATVPKVSLPGIVAGVVAAITGEDSPKTTTPSKAPQAEPKG